MKKKSIKIHFDKNQSYNSSYSKEPWFNFLNSATWDAIYSKMCLPSLLFDGNLSVMLRTSPHSLIKYSRSSSLHLLVSWASLAFSVLKASSRSKSSKDGFCSSRKDGGNT